MDAIGQRAEDAITNLEKAQIGTIHSFAGHILRLYPLEAAIAPDFEEDDGSGFEGHFEREWEWLMRVVCRSWRAMESPRRVPIDSLEVFRNASAGRLYRFHPSEMEMAETNK
jgi:ATP-dependent helicase/nuclease subunit A